MFDNWISSMSTLIPIPSHWLNNDPPAPIGQRMKEKMNVIIIVESGSAVIRLSGSNRVSGTKVVYMMLDFLYIAVPTSFQQHLAVLIICQSNNVTSTFSDAVQGFVHRSIPWHMSSPTKLAMKVNNWQVYLWFSNDTRYIRTLYWPQVEV